MAQTNVQAFSGDVEISGGITQGNQVLYPQRRWEIDLTSGTTTDRFYPTYLASSSPSDVGKMWPINFKVFGESLIGSDPYNEETLIGYARGGGYSDHRAMCKVHSTRYAASEFRFQGLWEGTSSFQNGFVIYMRGGYKYSILTDASTVVENKNIFVVGGSTYALKNSAGVDAYGTSVAISQVMNVTDFVQTGDVTATTGSLILPDSTARLGIGKTNPGSALDVVGDVAISSNLAVSGNLNATGNFLLSDGYTQIKDRVRVLNGETSFYDPDNVLRTARRTILEINATAPNASNTAQREYTGYIELEMTAQRTVAGYGTNSGGFVGRLNFALGYTTYPSEEWGPDSFVQEIKAYDPDTSANGLENVPRFRYKLDDATKKLQIFIEFDYQRMEASITWSVRMSSDSLDDVSIPSPTSEMGEGTLTTAPVGLAYDNNGNVGIGTATPGHKLDVNGNLGVRGKMLPDNLYTHYHDTGVITFAGNTDISTSSGFVRGSTGTTGPLGTSWYLWSIQRGDGNPFERAFGYFYKYIQGSNMSASGSMSFYVLQSSGVTATSSGNNFRLITGSNAVNYPTGYVIRIVRLGLDYSNT